MSRRGVKTKRRRKLVVNEKRRPPWGLTKANGKLMQKERDYKNRIFALEQQVELLTKMSTWPVPMVLHCPQCSTRHIDEGEFATKVHHTHSFQVCGLTWRPAVIATVGVRVLPGFKNEEKRT